MIHAPLTLAENYTMKSPNSSQFHGYYDAKVRPYLEYKGDLGWTTKIKQHTTIQERKLSYQFFPHFHPYTTELVQRLIAKSVSGLQAADTEYPQNDDGSFQTFPVVSQK